MANTEHLRRMAERMLAAAMTSSDEELAHALSVRASEYLDQAAALEASEGSQDVTRRADEPQPNEGKQK